MERNPLVSVLLTAYNRESLIAAAIESALAQMFDDFELLVVDDHSTDATLEIGQAYARRDPRVRVVTNDTNLGQFANRNHAARLARGRFLKYHDSDDVMYPHALAVMVPALLAEPSAGLAVSSGTCWAGGPCPMRLTPRMSYQREFLGQGMFMCGPSGALIRREVFQALGGFPEQGVGSDYLFWLAACARYHVLLLPADLFWYRLHDGQEFGSERAAWEYAVVPHAAWQALAADTCPLTAEERIQARTNLLYGVLKLTYRDARAGRWALARHRLRTLGVSTADWLRYLRRARRDALAGTPRDAHGEFIMPDWSRVHLPGSPDASTRA